METTINNSYTVNGMTCGHCAASVENTLKGLEGVKSAKVDLGAKNVQLEFAPGEIEADVMVKAIKEQGYELIMQG